MSMYWVCDGCVCLFVVSAWCVSLCECRCVWSVNGVPVSMWCGVCLWDVCVHILCNSRYHERMRLLC